MDKKIDGAAAHLVSPSKFEIMCKACKSKAAKVTAVEYGSKIQFFCASCGRKEKV